MIKPDRIVLALSICLLSPSAFAQSHSKVAVIVSTGDLGAQEIGMRDLETKALETYRTLGFTTVVVGGLTGWGSDPSPKSFIKEMGNLQGVKDLRIDFIGHGGLVPVADNQFRGQGVPVSNARRVNGDPLLDPKLPGKLVWLADDRTTIDGGYLRERAKLQGDIGMTSITHKTIEDGLAAFRKNNPRAVAALNFENCFSGAVAQTLRHTPNTIVFANSPLNDVATSRGTGLVSIDGVRDETIETIGGMSKYYAVLGQMGAPDLSLLDARGYANEEMRRELKDTASEVYHTGRSPIFESIIGWCEEGRPHRRTKPRTSDELKKIGKQDSDIAKAMSFAQLDAVRLRSAFDYSMKIPNFLDPSRLEVSVLENQYKLCLSKNAPRFDGPKGKEMAGDPHRQAMTRQRTYYKSDLQKPLKLLVHKLDDMLKDSSRHEQILARFKSAMEATRAELRAQRIPEDRWGVINNIFYLMDSGQLTKEVVVQDIKMWMSQVSADCVSIDSESCILDSGLLRDATRFIIGEDTKAKSQTNCPTDKLYFDCLYAGTPEFPKWWDDLESYWRGPEKTISLEEKCEEEPWVSVQKNNANIALDEKCMEDFVLYAPYGELLNLKRIYLLGLRDARGLEIPIGMIGSKLQPAAPAQAVDK